MSPRASVVVSTRNRPDDVVECVRSILESPRSDFELVVVDQSAPDVAARTAREVGADPRLRYVPSATKGLSVSRNVAIGTARGPVLAFTDDDCRIAPGWVDGVIDEFERDERLGILFGAVRLRPEDRARGYAAEFEPERPTEYVDRFPDFAAAWGVGANMSVRRSMLDRIGVFDPLLGAGAPLFAAEETDLTVRAITAGYKVKCTPAISVVHLGVREGVDASRLMRGYGIGVGAMLAKHVRLRTPGSARLFAEFVGHHGRRSIRNALAGHEHPGFGLVAAFLWGAASSSRYRLDRRSGLFAGTRGD